MMPNDTCQQIVEEIPWVVNGSSEAAERVCVYEHVTRCARCRQELAGVLALRRQVRNAVAGLPGADPRAWSALPGAAAEGQRSGRSDARHRLALVLEAMGLPFPASVLRVADALAGGRAALQVGVPMASPVRIRL